MKRILLASAGGIAPLAALASHAAGQAPGDRLLPVAVYEEKVYASLPGQITGDLYELDCESRPFPSLAASSCVFTPDRIACRTCSMRRSS